MAIAKFVQADTTSALSVAIHGPSWTVEAQLLAMVADTVAVANWQRAGKRSAPKPKRLPRPWEKPKTQALGRDAIPISQFNDWWESKAPKRPRNHRAAMKPPTSTAK